MTTKPSMIKTNYFVLSIRFLAITCFMPRSKLSSFVLINYLLLFGAGILWGSQYFFTKLALTSFSTSTIAAGRISIGFIMLLFLLAAQKKPKPSQEPQRSFWRCFPDFILIGLLEATIPCLVIGWAQMRLASSVTAIFIGTVPLFATLLESFFIKEVRLSLRKILGVVVGFFGIVVLVGPSFSLPTPASLESTSLLIPSLAVLFSAFCFSASMLLIKLRLGSQLDPLRSTQGILLGAMVTILPLAFWFAKPWTMTSFHCPFSALVSIVLLGILCSGTAYTLFVVLINRAGPGFASMCNYLVPPIGAFIGVVFSGEKLASTLVYSLLLILFSLWLASNKKRK